MTNYSDFGKSVLKKLIDLGQKQSWLIARVREKTGLYFDDSYLSKTLRGAYENPKIISAIKEILHI